MNDHIQGVLEGLGYCLTLLPTHGRASRAISERIVEITKSAAKDLQFRMRTTA